MHNMKITNLFFLISLFLQFKLYLTAEPSKQQDTENASSISSQTRQKLVLEESCSNSNLTSASDKDSEANDTQIAENSEILYKQVRDEFMQQSLSVTPYSGIETTAIQGLHNIILKLKMLNYKIYSKDTLLSRKIIIDTDNNLNIFKTVFHEYLNSVNSLIKKEIPRVSINLEQQLKDTYKKYNTIQWTYSNDNLVSEAEKILEEIIWTDPLPKKIRITKTQLYHKLYNLMNKLKEVVFSVEEIATDLEKINNSYTKTLENTLFRPMNMYSRDSRQSTFRDLLNELLLFIADYTEAAQNGAGKFPMTHNIEKLKDLLTETIKKTESHIRMHSRIIVSALASQKKKKKGKALTEALIGNMFFLYEHSIRDGRKLYDSVKREEYSSSVEGLCNLLKSEEGYFESLKDDSLDVIKAELKKTLTLEYSKLYSPYIEVAVKYYMKIISTMKFKAQLSFFLHLINKSIYPCKVVSGDAEGGSVTDYQCVKIDELSTMQHFFNEIKEYLQKIIEVNAAEKAIDSYQVESSRALNLTRKLQFFLGSACFYCRKVLESPGYKKGTTEYEAAIKRIFQSFWNALTSINEYYNKND